MSDFAPVLAYIHDYWPRIIRYHPEDEKTLIGLPYRYAVPSDGSMFQEMYYWDSYFMALGLVGTEHEAVIIDMVENLAYLFTRFGVIPNASRYYFLSRSQPPLLTQLIWLAYAVKQQRGDQDTLDFLARLMALAEEEHKTVWLGTAQPHYRQVHAGLSRYFDINFLDILASCESGWDHSTRCDERWLAHLPVDLNAILYQRECDFARAAEILGNPEQATYWQQQAQQRLAMMHSLMWDEAAGCFFDYDYANARRTPHPSLAAFYPMWAGLASIEQAARLVRDWLPRFELAGGLVTTLESKPGRQWAYPNGWAPLQWIVVAGLQRYGYQVEALRLCEKWCTNCAQVFAATGAMWEKYNVVELGQGGEQGLYGHVKGFGWSNAVFADFARLLG